MNRRRMGFTLAELAVVLLVLTLLIGGMLVPIAAQVDRRRVAETEKTLEEVKEALIGYALSHQATGNLKPYLPCPDNDFDGQEEPRAAGVCPSQEGWVPWATLGVGVGDAWGNRIRYRVWPGASSSVTGFTLTTFTGLPADRIRICSSGICTGTNEIAAFVPAVLVSHGKNGHGARTAANILLPVPAGAAYDDERANTDGRNGTDTADTPVVAVPPVFVSRSATGLESAAGEYDDISVWLSANVLISRMAAVGLLP